MNVWEIIAVLIGSGAAVICTAGAVYYIVKGVKILMNKYD